MRTVGVTRLAAGLARMTVLASSAADRLRVPSPNSIANKSGITAVGIAHSRTNTRPTVSEPHEVRDTSRHDRCDEQFQGRRRRPPSGTVSVG